MPVTFATPALQQLFSQLQAANRSDGRSHVDRAALDKIVAIIGARTGVTSDSIASDLKRGNLMPQEKLALAQRGLSPEEKLDILTVLDSPDFVSVLDPISTNFLKAIVGREPLKTIDSIATDNRVNTVGGARSPEQIAVQQLKLVMRSGKLNDYYMAAIGQKNDDPALKQKALDLFNALPSITPATGAKEMVRLGLLTAAPKNIDFMTKSPRYLPGRQILVETTVHSEVFDTNEFLSYEEDGVKAVTYRAKLVGEKGDNFLVEVDGRAEPLEVSKKSVYALNQPDNIEGKSPKIGWTTVQYDDPFTKAKVCEAALKMSDLVARIDFKKSAANQESGGILSFFRSFMGNDKLIDIQQDCVRIVHDIIDMKYPTSSSRGLPGRVSSGSPGRRAVHGLGVCNQQSEVMAALLAPFQDLIGVDIQMMSGGVYRNIKNRGQNPFRSGGHTWLQLSYRPSMELRICDRTWRQPNHEADRAYSRYGDRYPRRAGSNRKPIVGTDINFSGKYGVDAGEREFGEAGRDGREGHMSINQ